MRPYTLSPAFRERAMHTRGRVSNDKPLHPERTALLVVDMQNYFVAEGAVAEIPPARGIVPTINTLGAAFRKVGALVVWIQTVADGARERWGRHHADFLSPDRARRRLASLDRASESYALYPDLDVRAEDLRVTKIHYSALIPGSSDLDAQLRTRGIDTLLIAGAATNVCCESTARDAVMLDYRTIMVSDANATWTDEEHAATLDLFTAFFGDVMTAAEAIRRLESPRQDRFGS